MSLLSEGQPEVTGADPNSDLPDPDCFDIDKELALSPQVCYDGHQLHYLPTAEMHGGSLPHGPAATFA